MSESIQRILVDASEYSEILRKHTNDRTTPYCAKEIYVDIPFINFVAIFPETPNIHYYVVRAYSTTELYDHKIACGAKCLSKGEEKLAAVAELEEEYNSLNGRQYFH